MLLMSASDWLARYNTMQWQLSSTVNHHLKNSGGTFDGYKYKQRYLWESRRLDHDPRISNIAS